MSCTTILVGKKASNDGSTMIARTDDRHFDVKRMTVVLPEEQPRHYRSVQSQVEIVLPNNPLRYTSCPSVDPKNGIWAACGINSANVSMSATETISTNPRVLAADPFVEKDETSPGGIGEEDIVVLVLPYIHSAREGVERLADLLEKYGTYESNGIAFSDLNEIWWMETIGGHHWIAKRVPDDVCVIMPNQFGMDCFNLEDAFGEQKDNLCSNDLKEFIRKNNLDLNVDKICNPRKIFGSRRDYDHIYNTPRAWYMGSYLAPVSFTWVGENADYTPESDNIPWAIKPDQKVTVEDVRYLLSSHYQGTDYDPYINRDTGKRGMYLSIGVNHTGVTSICQIRPDLPDEIKAIEWICFGSTTFGAFLPLYTNVDVIPDYLSKVDMKPSTDNLYWNSRLIAAMADKEFSNCIKDVEIYQSNVLTKGRQIIDETDKAVIQSKTGTHSETETSNERIAEMVRIESLEVLDRVLRTSSEKMKNGYNRELY